MRMRLLSKMMCNVHVCIQTYICLSRIVLWYHSGKQCPQRWVSRIAVNKTEGFVEFGSYVQGFSMTYYKKYISELVLRMRA